jgi:hypothetical protein
MEGPHNLDILGKIHVRCCIPVVMTVVIVGSKWVYYYIPQYVFKCLNMFNVV